MSEKELLSHLGIKYFYNENCRPAIMAYSMDSFVKEDGMNADYINESQTRAKADKIISSFLHSDVNALTNVSTTKEKITDAMVKASHFKDKTSYKNSKNKDLSLIKETSKEFQSRTQMELIGLEDARVWEIDKGYYKIIGVIRYYSMDSIENAKKRFNPDTKEQTSKSENKKKSASIKRTNNLDVDDF